MLLGEIDPGERAARVAAPSGNVRPMAPETAPRLDPYSFVHKMQRARLFALVIEAGRLDETDPAGVQALGGAVRALVSELRAHAGHEEQFIHPLLRRYAPGVAAQLDSEHVKLDQLLADLETAASPTDLYRRLASFTAHYLQHLEVEEAAGLSALWKNCSDEELGQILVSFRGSRSDMENFAGVLSQLPTLAPGERSGFLALALGQRDRAEVALLLATLLTPGQLGRLG
jgi:hypothetical protein